MNTFCGPIRCIPFRWTVAGMSFGVFGVFGVLPSSALLPLYVVRKKIKRRETLTAAPDPGPVALLEGGLHDPLGEKSVIPSASSPSPLATPVSPTPGRLPCTARTGTAP